MSEIATYTFLPWMRQGIANEFQSPIEGDLRAKIEINIAIKDHSDNKDAVAKEIEIYGPGDIVGIDSRAIVKVEPRNWITNFEPNYLPYIEFYDEDFPWRYSPAANPGVGQHRLSPWLTLIVLKEDEFVDGQHVKDKPLPFIVFNENAQLQNPEEIWAWSHVHLNEDLLGEDVDGDEIIFSLEDGNYQCSKKVEALLNRNPDLGYSRVLCPRRLEPKVAYHAFLVPAFESGRLAGMGEQPTGGTTKSWDGARVSGGMHQMPFYHRWYFRTGTVGDFEYLVRLLEPKPVDSRVGLRDMDVQNPGANIKGIKDEPLNGILKLGGALRIPRAYYTAEELSEVNKYDQWATKKGTEPYPHDFQKSLASFVNLSDSYARKKAEAANQDADIEEEQSGCGAGSHDISGNPDPLITAPLYGKWHALTQRLLKDRDGNEVSPNENWVHELNLDPRWRVSAGFGTKVVQENQENYIESAWKQIGEVLEANRKIREAQIAKVVSGIQYTSQIQNFHLFQPDKWLTLGSPLHRRILSNGKTAFFQKKESKVTLASTSIAMRKVLRTRGKLVNKRMATRPHSAMASMGFVMASLSGSSMNPNTVVSEINTGKLSSAPVRGIPDYTEGVWGPLGEYEALIRRMNLEEQMDRLIFGEGFTIKDLSADQIDLIVREPKKGTNEESELFKEGLKDLLEVIHTSQDLGVKAQRARLGVSEINQAVFQRINPDTTIPRWLFSNVKIPISLWQAMRDEFAEVMAYPRFDLPMYRPLAEYSSELFLPNLNYISQNSISLLETNQKFIESYMIGLNHEFARELLWREYPTDQRGSYFRQFWETAGYLDTQSLDRNTLLQRYSDTIYTDRLIDHQNLKKKLVENVNLPTKLLREAQAFILKEELKDIKPIHYWHKHSKLGDHDNREKPGENEEEVVLVIRGELLKKYPTAVIYAHKAEWSYKMVGDSETEFELDASGDQIIDLTKERVLAPIPEGTNGVPPADIVKSPLYEAKVEPDIYFFGFDLTVCKAKGGSGDEGDQPSQFCADQGVEWDDPGWFFVIKERPGEPRFGLDIGDGGNLDEANKIQIWNDLSWGDLKIDQGEYLDVASQEIIVAEQVLGDSDAEKTQQQTEDKKIKWNSGMDAADLAYILYQVPVLVAVHAVEMLPE